MTLNILNQFELQYTGKNNMYKLITKKHKLTIFEDKGLPLVSKNGKYKLYKYYSFSGDYGDYNSLYYYYVEKSLENDHDDILYYRNIVSKGKKDREEQLKKFLEDIMIERNEIVAQMKLRRLESLKGETVWKQ